MDKEWQLGGLEETCTRALNYFGRLLQQVDLLIDLNGGTTLPSFVTVVCIIPSSRGRYKATGHQHRATHINPFERVTIGGDIKFLQCR